MGTLGDIAYRAGEFILGEATIDALTWRQPLYDESQRTDFNPDSLVEKKGIKIYRQMGRDDQVKACLKLKNTAIYSKGWRMEPASSKPKDVEIADYCDFALRDGIVGSFTKVLRGILTAYKYGFSVSEKIPYIIPAGQWAGKIAYRRIKTRPPDGFEFTTSDYGDLIVVTQNAERDTIKLFGPQLRNLICYSYGSEFGDIWGESDLKAAYRPWISKDIIIRHLNIYVERFGMGIILGKYPRGMGKKAQDNLEKVIKRVQAKTSAKIPRDVDIDILETKSRTQPIYVPVIEHYNKSISRAVLLPDKLGFTDSPGGSYNLGENQFSLWMMMMDNEREEIAEEVVDEQIIKDLVLFNFPNVVEFPKFRFNPLTQADKIELAKLYVQATDKGIITHTEKDEDYFRESIDYPARDMDSPVIKMPTKVTSIPNADPNKGGANPDADELEEEEKKAEFQRSLRRRPNRFEAQIDFQRINDGIDVIEDKSAVGIGRVIDRMKEDLINSITSRRIVEDRKSKEVNNIKLKFLGDLRFEFGQMLLKMFELGKSDGFKDVAIKKAGINLQAAPLMSTLPPKEVLKLFEAKKFWLTGTERDKILKDAKGILFQAIESGETNSETIFKMENYFANNYKVEQRLPSGATRPIEKIPGRISTVVRTNTNDAYNQGRLAAFRDPAVINIVEAYEYSAILDTVTSDICDALDGVIYLADDPIWSKLTPSNHFNCRSILIPLLAGEDFRSNPMFNLKPPPVEPAVGFGG